MKSTEEVLADFIQLGKKPNWTESEMQESSSMGLYLIKEKRWCGPKLVRAIEKAINELKHS